MTPWKIAAALCLACCGTAAADAISTLNDATLFKGAEKDVAAMPRAELDALTQALATCSAASIGQRMQQFECERSIDVYWAQYNRERPIDNYMAALGGLFAGFDNNALNPTQQMMDTYKRAANDVVILTKDVNRRYRQIERP